MEFDYIYDPIESLNENDLINSADSLIEETITTNKPHDENSNSKQTNESHLLNLNSNPNSNNNNNNNHNEDDDDDDLNNNNNNNENDENESLTFTSTLINKERDEIELNETNSLLSIDSEPRFGDLNDIRLLSEKPNNNNSSNNRNEFHLLNSNNGLLDEDSQGLINAPQSSPLIIFPKTTTTTTTRLTVSKLLNYNKADTTLKTITTPIKITTKSTKTNETTTTTERRTNTSSLSSFKQKTSKKINKFLTKSKIIENQPLSQALVKAASVFTPTIVPPIVNSRQDSIQKASKPTIQTPVPIPIPTPVPLPVPVPAPAPAPTSTAAPTATDNKILETEKEQETTSKEQTNSSSSSLSSPNIKLNELNKLKKLSIKLFDFKKLPSNKQQQQFVNVICHENSSSGGTSVSTSARASLSNGIGTVQISTNGLPFKSLINEETKHDTVQLHETLNDRLNDVIEETDQNLNNMKVIENNDTDTDTNSITNENRLETNLEQIIESIQCNYIESTVELNTIVEPDNNKTSYGNNNNSEIGNDTECSIQNEDTGQLDEELNNKKSKSTYSISEDGHHGDDALVNEVEPTVEQSIELNEPSKDLVDKCETNTNKETSTKTNDEIPIQQEPELVEESVNQQERNEDSHLSEQNQQPDSTQANKSVDLDKTNEIEETVKPVEEPIEENNAEPKLDLRKRPFRTNLRNLKLANNKKTKNNQQKKIWSSSRRVPASTKAELKITTSNPKSVDDSKASKEAATSIPEPTEAAAAASVSAESASANAPIALNTRSTNTSTPLKPLIQKKKIKIKKRGKFIDSENLDYKRVTRSEWKSIINKSSTTTKEKEENSKIKNAKPQVKQRKETTLNKSLRKRRSNEPLKESLQIQTRKNNKKIESSTSSSLEPEETPKLDRELRRPSRSIEKQPSSSAKLATSITPSTSTTTTTTTPATATPAASTRSTSSTITTSTSLPLATTSASTTQLTESTLESPVKTLKRKRSSFSASLLSTSFRELRSKQKPKDQQQQQPTPTHKQPKKSISNNFKKNDSLDESFLSESESGLRRSKRVRVEHNETPIYNFEEVKDFNGNTVIVSKLVGTRKRFDQFSFYREMLNKSTTNNNSKSTSKSLGRSSKSSQLNDTPTKPINNENNLSDDEPVNKIAGTMASNDSTKETTSNTNGGQEIVYVQDESILDSSSFYSYSKLVEDRVYEECSPGVQISIISSTDGILSIEPSQTTQVQRHNAKVIYVVQKGTCIFSLNGDLSNHVEADVIKIPENRNEADILT